MLVPGTFLRAGQSSLLAVTEAPGCTGPGPYLRADPVAAGNLAERVRFCAATLFLANLVFAGPLRAPASIPPFT